MITNFLQPVQGYQLTEQELIVTLAFILRGNYNPGNRSYITTTHARSFKAVNTFIKACEDLGIPEYNVKSKKKFYQLYYGGKQLKMLFAKQALLPERFRWKQIVRIPQSWIGQLPNPVLHRLLNFTKDFLPNKDAKINKGKFAGPIYDKPDLHESLIELFKPIAPQIHIDYIDDIRTTCLMGVDTELLINAPVSVDNYPEDIQDLL